MQLFSVEETKVCVYKVNAVIDEKRQIFEVNYILFPKDLILSFSPRSRGKYVRW